MVEASERFETVQDHIAKELLLLDIARAARGRRIDPAKLGGEPRIAESEIAFDIAATRARLGCIYPCLTPEHDAAVILVFAKRYKKPCLHAHGDSHAHHHGGRSCSKGGPVHRLMRRLERKILTAIGDRKGHQIVAVLLRGWALLFCPGDDLTSMAMQVYGSISGQGEHSRHIEQAILPPRIVLQKTVVRLRTPLGN